jgi:small subunit ribosomal protein S16
MLTIRLQRTGKKNQADFRIVLAEKESPVQKKFIEILGSYNPRRKTFQVKEERVKYWVGQRVELSETMHNLFVTKGFVQGAKVKAFSIPKKPVEPAAPAAAPAAPSETPADVAEATETMEAKVEETTVPEVTTEKSTEEAKSQSVEAPGNVPPAEEVKPAETPVQ